MVDVTVTWTPRCWIFDERAEIAVPQTARFETF
jgi:hypothetical protein